MARGTSCAAHTHDTTIPQESHHVWPLGYHGPNTAANRALVCCNAHSDAHYFLEHLLRHGGQWPDDWRTYGPRVRAIALSGYAQVMAYGASLTQH